MNQCNIYDDFEISFMRNSLFNTEEVISHVNDTYIVKNPKSLKYIASGARGLICKFGNLYLASDNNNVIHIDILNSLEYKGIITDINLSKDTYKLNPTQFIFIQRIWNKPIFTISEMYNIYNDEKSYFDKFNYFVEMCKMKNPQYEFININVKLAAKKYLNKKELINFFKFGS